MFLDRHVGLEPTFRYFEQLPFCLVIKPKMPTLLNRYRSLAGALHRRALSFGRGGMFVRDSRSLPEDVPIGFQFRFAEGSATRMYGSGILRWQRPLPRKLPAGMGIEILHLDSEALDPVVQWISDTKPRAFIPRE